MRLRCTVYGFIHKVAAHLRSFVNIFGLDKDVILPTPGPLPLAHRAVKPEKRGPVTAASDVRPPTGQFDFLIPKMTQRDPHVLLFEPRHA
jgi:hypothetical protein